jgi:hypothetical protein
MPTLAELRNRFGSASRGPGVPLGGDETLVADSRSKLSPAQIVEQKLRQALCASHTLSEMLGNRRRKKSRT